MEIDRERVEVGRVGGIEREGGEREGEGKREKGGEVDR